ncbi:MAG: hypothetical protein HPY76_10995 [Anaerolineae bacterium]|jgi:hypothetical protein|nr:hypothetical protein [Anaerolineae bacterium]
MQSWSLGAPAVIAVGTATCVGGGGSDVAVGAWAEGPPEQPTTNAITAPAKIKRHFFTGFILS